MTTSILTNGLKHIKSSIKFNSIRLDARNIYFILDGEPIAQLALHTEFRVGDTVNLDGVTGKIKVTSQKP